MDLSMNEVEAQARKAAKGAGYSWGEADEVGKAVRWLSARGLDGSHHLALLFSKTVTPEICPIRFGIQISDTATNLAVCPARSGLLAEPMLALPFVAFAAEQTQQSYQIRTETWSVIVDAAGLEQIGRAPDRVDWLEVSVTAQRPQPLSVKSRAHPNADSWATLTRFAHLTYAPATEESRLRGAGAGLSDND